MFWGGRIGSVLYQPFRAIKQQYFRDVSCPDWVPPELCEPCLKANAKIAGDHFIHIDKVRQNTIDHEAKEELIKILSDWFDNKSFDKNVDLPPASNITDVIDLKNLKNLHQPAKPIGGPGTELKKLLNKIGIKAEPGCSCNSRAGIMDSNEYREPGWCEKNINTIIGWLKEEASKRKLLFIDSLARLLIKKAIKNSRKY